MIQKDKNLLSEQSSVLELEWLETNGLGGWSSSTLGGAHTRRYHGLLMAATVPPVERKLLLSSLEETIVIGDHRYEWGMHVYQSGIVHPQGNQLLSKFSKDLYPEWIYDFEGVQIRKSLLMIHSENTVVIWYDILQAPGNCRMEWLPLMAARGYHQLQQEGPGLHWDVDFSNGVFHNRPDGENNVYISIPESQYHHHPQWYRRFEYPVEQYRGLDFQEDLLNHGTFFRDIQSGDRIGIIVSTQPVNGRDSFALAEQEIARRRNLIVAQQESDFKKQLMLAADQFIVARGSELKTVIAGYHWFTDWGRDTMISLPGLCLATGRFEDARKILQAFADVVDAGMLPNRFQDNLEEPEYNNVDGTLWYFIAVYKYLQATGDAEFVLNKILPVLRSIVEWHSRGTRFNIKVDEDGLLYAGQEGQQLTWMDARIGDWVVTPRMGKPVEIQALWYNAQLIFAELLAIYGDSQQVQYWRDQAAKTKESFLPLFWNAAGGYLYDVINEQQQGDASFRPNQLFAISLPFPLIEDEQARRVLSLVSEKLYIPAGIRTLPSDDNRYVEMYGGDQWHRDSSYHQGTAWTWLIGPYVDALAKTGHDREKLQAIIDQCKPHLGEGCLGSVSEILDAGSSHHPRGCVAQAWGVAEWLRVVHDYQLT